MAWHDLRSTSRVRNVSMPSSPRRGWLKWTLVAVAAGISVLVAGSLIFLRPAFLEATIEDELEDRLGVDVTIGDVELRLWPRPAVSVTDIVFNLRQRDRPAFIRIASVSAEIGPFSVWRGHVDRVEARGLHITVPPRRARTESADGPTKLDSDVIIDRLEAYDAKLTIERVEPDKEPLVFAIHELSLNDVGAGRVMPFKAVLTNPVPEGRVETTGHIGPWNPADPSAIALGGEYTFRLVNLGSIPGIGGALQSSGTYDGRLTEVVVNGTADTPDFSLDLGGRRLPLHAKFKARVDGSDGSTVLEHVEATLKNTPMIVQGRIENLPGPGRRHIALEADVQSGRIEDLLELVIDAPASLSGDVSLKASISLPPGPQPVGDRLVVEGAFGLPGTAFSDPTVRAKLAEFSRRSLGRDEGAKGPVQGRLAGKFKLASSRLSLRSVTFAIPGAEVRVQGTYALKSDSLNLAGDVRMAASLSKVAGGWKGLMIKPFDWFFRRDGAGTVIPITITGNPAKPNVGVNVRRLVRRGG
jgi:hypothetical protein